MPTIAHTNHGPPSLHATPTSAPPPLSFEDALAFIEECDVDILTEEHAAFSTATLINNKPTKQSSARKKHSPTSSGTSSSSRSSHSSPARDEPASVHNKRQSSKKQSDQTAATVTPRKPPVKRVRRQRQELLYLREKVVELEQELVKLTHSSEESCACDTPPNESSLCQRVVSSAWENVAARQLMERQRAEQQNYSLKKMLGEHVQLAKTMQRILEEQATDESPLSITNTTRCARYCEWDPAQDQLIFQNQLADIEKAYDHAEFDRQSSEIPSDAEGSHSPTVQIKESSGNDFVVQLAGEKVLPFDLSVTSNAMWRFVTLETMKKNCYYERTIYMDEHISAHSLGIRVDFDEMTGDLHVHVTTRKYVHVDKVIFLLKATVRPVELHGLKLHGLLCDFSGWVVARRSNPTMDNVPSTSMNVSWTVVPHIEDDITEKDWRVGVVLDFILNYHEIGSNHCREAIHELLMEEDWKMNVMPTIIVV